MPEIDQCAPCGEFVTDLRHQAVHRITPRLSRARSDSAVRCAEHGPDVGVVAVLVDVDLHAPSLEFHGHTPPTPSLRRTVRPRETRPTSPRPPAPVVQSEEDLPLPPSAHARLG